MSKFVDDYCDLSSFDEKKNDPVFYAHDCSPCSLIEVSGTKEIFSTEEYLTNMRDFIGLELAPLLKKSGHALTISFEESSSIDQSIETLFNPIYHNAAGKNLNLTSIIDETRKNSTNSARYYKMLIAVWSFPSLLTKKDLKQAQALNREKRRGLLFRAINVMNPFSSIEALDHEHNGFVRRVLSALDKAGIVAKLLTPKNGKRPDLAEIRRGLLFHETPSDWSPFGVYDRKYAGVKSSINTDMSEFFSPPLSMQIMSSAAKAENFRNIEIGGRAYALAIMQLFPRELSPFLDFAKSIRTSGDRDMPLRFTIHLEGGEFNTPLKNLLSNFASLTSASAKNLYQNLRLMKEVADRDIDTFVKSWIISCTWREPYETDEILEHRRSYLTRTLMSWGSGLVTDSTSNPLRTLSETVAGLVSQVRTVKPTFAPVTDMAQLLPFHFSAPIFEKGETIFTTMDGQLAPHEAFSKDQQFWFTLIFAPPGSGKSVLMNRLNYEFTAYSAGKSLPFVCVIDIGVSASGYIKLIQEALPENRRHEAFQKRLINARHAAINPFDIGLGHRMPLLREKQFIDRFLQTLVGDEARAHLYEQIIQAATQRAFQEKSDLEINSFPNTYEAGKDPEVDKACLKHGVHIGAKEKWWSIVDGLAEAGDFINAERAQRQAVPLIKDIISVLSQPTMTEEFDTDAVKYVKTRLTSSLDEFRIFAYETQLDFGAARIAVIDLNDVVINGQDAHAYRNNALMYMIARNIFVQKIGGDVEEIKTMKFPARMQKIYKRFWEKHYEDIRETPKRLCYDEYHMTGGIGQISSQVVADVRVCRKWGLEIILASQFLKDFSQNLQNVASTTFILASGSEESRNEIQKTFGFSDAVKEQLRQFVHGTKNNNKNGVNFLANYKLKTGERWIVLNNFPGAKMLWALTTVAQDREVRDEMYRRMSVTDALTMLANRYPAATVGEDWRRIADQVDKEASIAKKLVDEIIMNSQTINTMS